MAARELDRADTQRERLAAFKYAGWLLSVALAGSI
jgi:hypothetical protein